MATEGLTINVYQYTNWLTVQAALYQIEADRPSNNQSDRQHYLGMVAAYQTALRAVAYIKVPKYPES